MSNPTDQEQVNAHIKNLDPAIREAVQTLRQIILASDAEIAEQIKWNNPSFYYSGEMAAFDPKEYKRDIVVMNLHRNRLMLVLPSGAKLADETQLLEGKYADGRRIITFKDRQDIEAKAKALQSLLKQWVAMVEK